MAQVQITYGLTFLVADSALSSAENLQKLAETRTKGITRVPATLREHRRSLAQADPQTMAPLDGPVSLSGESSPHHFD